MHTLGRYPSRVFRAAVLESSSSELFIKDDGALRDDYGGNKVRKLEGILPKLAARGTRRILTVGPAGSHHVLATTLLARELGMSTAAVLFPQPWSEHAEATLRAALGAGLEPLPVSRRAGVMGELVRSRRRGDAFVPPGGSNLVGAAGYARAVAELKEQIQSEAVPEPDLIFIALGSGGTAAGLLAGLVLEGLSSSLVAVDVGAAGHLAEALLLTLAGGLLAQGGAATKIPGLRARFRVDRRYRGARYGVALDDFSELLGRAREWSLSLDQTYTGKALSAALDCAVRRDIPKGLSERIGQKRRLRVLYWHSLSHVLPASGPALTRELRQLFALPGVSGL